MRHGDCYPPAPRSDNLQEARALLSEWSMNLNVWCLREDGLCYGQHETTPTCQWLKTANIHVSFNFVVTTAGWQGTLLTEAIQGPK